MSEYQRRVARKMAKVRNRNSRGQFEVEYEYDCCPECNAKAVSVSATPAQFRKAVREEAMNIIREVLEKLGGE